MSSAQLLPTQLMLEFEHLIIWEEGGGGQVNLEGTFKPSLFVQGTWEQPREMRKCYVRSRSLQKPPSAKAGGLKLSGMDSAPV